MLTILSSDWLIPPQVYGPGGKIVHLEAPPEDTPPAAEAEGAEPAATPAEAPAE